MEVEGRLELIWEEMNEEKRLKNIDLKLDLCHR